MPIRTIRRCINGVEVPLTAVAKRSKSVNGTAHAIFAYVLSRRHGAVVYLVPPAGLAPALSGGAYPDESACATTGFVAKQAAAESRTLADELDIAQEHGWLPNKTVGLEANQLVKLNHMSIQPTILLCSPLANRGTP